MSRSDVAISARSVSKRYEVARASPAAADRPSGWLRRITRSWSPPAVDPFWALRDVSFEVARGDVVGVIGRNGAGKSTLLKVLSRIVEPTAGEIELRGRVGSLLEVGTGFHPDLTGRENVFLNGQILGMRRAEVQRHFDAIVDFAQVEQFIDTPVKRYSSGMYVRLAFAVAAHLTTEILIVDEVLAVGDMAFQAKCLGRMSEMTRTGRTVLFVSHSMPAVARLCRSAVVLDAGTTTGLLPVAEAIAAYTGAAASTVERTFAQGDGVRVTLATVAVGSGGTWRLRLAVANCDVLPELVASFTLHDAAGLPVYASDARYDSGRVTPLHPRGPDAHVAIDVTDPRLRPGRYTLSLYVGDLLTNHWVSEHCLAFDVPVGESLTSNGAALIGSVVPATRWQLVDAAEPTPVP